MEHTSLTGRVFAQPADGGQLVLVEDGKQLGQGDLRAAGRYADAMDLAAARERMRCDIDAAVQGNNAGRPRQCQGIPALEPLTRER